MQATSIHDSVREHYAELARSSNACCGNNELYPAQLLTDLPAEVSTFTLGCGDPITLAQLKPGETVLDLGSGGGLDCFLAAKQVGAAGHVIGVDMTPDMLAKARANAQRLGYPNVEFREGYLEALPIEDKTIDVVISNCVLNLSPDKPQVFREVFRTLKPGGHVAVSDIVTNGTLPDKVQKSMELWGACVAGALDQRDYVRGLREAGFVNVQVRPKSQTDRAMAALPIGVPFSATVTARRPLENEPSLGEMSSDATLESTVPASAQFNMLKQLLGDVTGLDLIENGYDLRLQGDPSVIRAGVEELRRAIPLNLELVEAADGTHVRITSVPETAFASLSSIN
jgi:arsenite methyltransferase